MDILFKESSTYFSSKPESYNNFYVMNDKINDWHAILVFIAHLTFDIDWLVRRRNDSWIWHVLILLHVITGYCVYC